MLTLDERISFYQRRGWCPVPWAHQPDHVRAAIRYARMIPKIKGCFENSQRVVLHQDVVPLTYCEGWVRTTRLSVPIEHAWIKDDNGRYDLTLPMDEVEPLVWWSLDPDEARAGLVSNGYHGPIDEQRFRSSLRDAYLKCGIDLSLLDKFREQET